MAIAKGNSLSHRLFELVLWIKAMQMKYGFELYMIHMAGTRIIEQGTDRLSRGVVKVQDLIPKPLREYASLNLHILQRLASLSSWIRSWIGLDYFMLEPEHWFIDAHNIRFTSERKMFIQSSTYVWTPPPCIANVAIEQLRYMRIKRQRSTHVMIVPKLFFGL